MRQLAGMVVIGLVSGCSLILGPDDESAVDGGTEAEDAAVDGPLPDADLTTWTFTSLGSFSGARTVLGISELDQTGARIYVNRTGGFDEIIVDASGVPGVISQTEFPGCTAEGATASTEGATRVQDCGGTDTLVVEGQAPTPQPAASEYALAASGIEFGILSYDGSDARLLTLPFVGTGPPPKDLDSRNDIEDLSVVAAPGGDFVSAFRVTGQTVFFPDPDTRCALESSDIAIATVANGMPRLLRSSAGTVFMHGSTMMCPSTLGYGLDADQISALPASTVTTPAAWANQGQIFVGKLGAMMIASSEMVRDASGTVDALQLIRISSTRAAVVIRLGDEVLVGAGPLSF